MSIIYITTLKIKYIMTVIIMNIMSIIILIDIYSLIIEFLTFHCHI